MSGVGTSDSVAALSRPAESRKTPLGALGIGSLTAILWWLSGVEALVVAVPVVAIWYGTSAPYAIAAAHVALIALVPAVPSAALVAFEASALAVLLGDAPKTTGAVRVPLLRTSAVATAGLAVIAYGGLDTSGEIWVAATALGGAFTLSAYGLHRYGVVQRQLREGSHES